jgi:hypothetical protein
MLALAVPLALTLTLAPTAAQSRLELNADTGLTPGTLSYPRLYEPLRRDGDGLQGEGSAGLTLFTRPVVDDDAPPALQPYLQYVGRVHLGGSGRGGYSNVPFSDGPARDHRTLTGGYVDAWADGYVDRKMYLSASIAFHYTDWQSPTLHVTEMTLPFSLGLGIRLGNARLAAGWGATPYRSTAEDAAGWQVRFWGGAWASAYAVIEKRLELFAGLSVIDGGALVRASVTGWFGRRIGLTTGIRGGRGGYFDSPERYATVGGWVDLAFWPSHRWAVSFDYAPTWQQALDNDVVVVTEVDHVVTLGVVVRP